MRILVTGSSSHLAQALLPQLCALPDIERITGIDIRPARFRHDKFQAVRADLRNADLMPLLDGQDALIHLAFVVLRGKISLSEMRAINLDASMRLFDAAAELGIARIVHLSSASVYGNGTNLNESAAFNPLPGFIYAEHKAALETWLASHHPGVICLRPHIILGPQAQPLLVNILRMPFYIKLPDPQPLLQCVHENDVARAIVLVLKGASAAGAYNLAADPSFSLRAAIRQRHRYAVALPFSVARTSLDLACKIAGIGGEAGWIDGAHHNLTLDCGKAGRELGWRAEIDTEEMLKPA
ncbi:MAG TPA: NAD-dependent epimerase/dehydratase family protein [Burkholderiales bacterium]|nr:NAD-dependent epimerase/dehydratase family protein [Burkholderiales bacterium]